MARPWLDVPHLAMLAAVARTGSLARAAAELGLTQPALSYRVREAERRLGTALFARGKGRRMRLTPAAERLLPTAELVLAELGRAEDDIRRFASGIRYVVRVGSRAATCFYWLPQFLQRLKSAHPEIEVELVSEAVAHPLEALMLGIIDVAIVHGRRPGEAFRCHGLFRDELVGIVAASHPLAEWPVLQASDFADQPYVSHDVGGELGEEIELALRPAGVVPARFVRSGMLDATFELVRAGFGVSIVSRWAARPYVERGLVAARPLGAKGLHTEWFAVVRAAEGAATPADFLAERLSYWCGESGRGFLDPIGRGAESAQATSRALSSTGPRQQ